MWKPRSALFWTTSASSSTSTPIAAPLNCTCVLLAGTTFSASGKLVSTSGECAFDTVPHEALLNKLQELQLDGIYSQVDQELATTLTVESNKLW